MAQSANPSARARPKLVVCPDRLQKFLDAPAIANAAQQQRGADIKASTKARSWNDERCDTREFARLRAPDEVICTDDQRRQRLMGIAAMPPSGLMTRDFVPVSSGVMDESHPRSAETSTPLTAPVMIQREGAARGPQIAHVTVPASVLLHEQGLMTPAQRRERLQFETQYQQARRAMERTERDTRRMHQLVQTRFATSDVLNTDHLGRDVTADNTRQAPDPSSSILAPSLAPATDRHEPREFQKKGDRFTPQISTHDRIFNETPISWDPQRAQQLRNEGQAGRPFNIVNGGRVDYVAPTIPEKQHARQGHPSIIVHPYSR